MSVQFPLALRALSERLHFRVRGPQRVVRLDAFLVDLTDWKLSLTDKTPCFWIHRPEHLNQTAIDLAEEVRDAVREAKWQNELILVLVDGPADDLRRSLGTSFTHSGAFTQFAILDDRQQKEIFEAGSPTRLMQDWLLEQIPRLQLSPYETSRPVVGNRFFGRQSYLNKILSHPTTNYLVVGIRRIGKSSLLHEVQRQLDLSDPPAEGQSRRLYVDCSVIKTPDEFYREIILHLSPRDLKRFQRQSQSLRFQTQMFEYLAHQHGGQITYILDEVDGLIDSLGHNLSMFEVLRKASSRDGVARFIVAGFRQLRQSISNIDAPLYHFGETVTLKAMERDEVKDMVVGPLEQLRIKLESRDEIAQRIYRETAGLPNLVQFYCKALLEHLDATGGKTLSTANLQTVYDNDDFRDFLVQTFLYNSLPLERAVVFAMAAMNSRPTASFSLKDIDLQFNRRNLHVDFTPLEEACQNLVKAGILQSQGKQYGFAIPLFARMLEEKYSLDYVFDKARREFLVAESTRAEH